MSGAIGLTLGPIIASFLSRYFDYVGTLLVFSLLILVVGCTAVSQLPSNLDKAQSEEAPDALDKETNN